MFNMLCHPSEWYHEYCCLTFPAYYWLGYRCSPLVIHKVRPANEACLLAPYTEAIPSDPRIPEQTWPWLVLTVVNTNGSDKPPMWRWTENGKHYTITQRIPLYGGIITNEEHNSDIFRSLIATVELNNQRWRKWKNQGRHVWWARYTFSGVLWKSSLQLRH